MERNIKADAWSSLQAKNLGFFLGILSDLLGLSGSKFLEKTLGPARKGYA